MNIKLKTISKQSSNGKIILDPKLAEVLPVIRGKGDVNLLCGGCGALLVQGIYGGRIEDIIIHCPVCDSYNNMH